MKTSYQTQYLTRAQMQHRLLSGNPSKEEQASWRLAGGSNSSPVSSSVEHYSSIFSSGAKRKK